MFYFHLRLFYNEYWRWYLRSKPCMSSFYWPREQCTSTFRAHTQRIEGIDLSKSLHAFRKVNGYNLSPLYNLCVCVYAHHIIVDRLWPTFFVWYWLGSGNLLFRMNYDGFKFFLISSSFGIDISIWSTLQEKECLDVGLIFYWLWSIGGHRPLELFYLSSLVSNKQKSG